MQRHSLRGHLGEGILEQDLRSEDGPNELMRARGGGVRGGGSPPVFFLRVGR
jgi:hypothetical protein